LATSAVESLTQQQVPVRSAWRNMQISSTVLMWDGLMNLM